jgi:hypothetical protein
LIFLSVNNIVIAPARTGNANTNNIAVRRTDQQKRGVLRKVIPPYLIPSIVTIKFNEPKIEETPAKCKLKIKKSIDGEGDPITLLKGG